MLPDVKNIAAGDEAGAGDGMTAHLAHWGHLRLAALVSG